MESIITQLIDKFKTGDLKAEGGKKFAKLRDFAKNSFYLLAFLLSIGIAFFAGRTIKFLENRPNFVFEAQGNISNAINENKIKDEIKVSDVATIVASKGGKKYYFVWCKGAENIKEKNKRFFKTENAAQSAGYTLAASCK